MLELQSKVFGPYQTNSYLLIDSVNKEALLIDVPADAQEILAWVEPYRIQTILLTHGHADHVGALEEVRKALDVHVALHRDDQDHFDLEAEQTLEANQRLQFGASLLEVVHIPGHTPGSVALKVVEGDRFNFAIVGDAIFPGGPGHTTSPEALRQSLDSLAASVFIWPDFVRLYPGHGTSTTVGEERAAFQAFYAQPLQPDLFGDVLWRES
jgi:glyoxylase-like metal-dependent hydrolase (beta-lactamase superfamily II)